ncbi:MAG: tRNA uridine-5-carboxymethylaminomethyl(34) synthesis enzyme MnmG [Erysipelotrichaceae bacterium]|jgi:tRNA uridine 5-carboxymethylaminomethyl modification enzyme|nr:tRNA uridine-5-carboxymethylaminomethyl(34) synthesis enzyme MnmG [Erysipelotrichaceae bacterium]
MQKEQTIHCEILVVGGGHAGVEAALASARLGADTILVTLDKNRLASMPCNPSVGGPAKGIVTREIDALGGQMGRTADLTALQFKMLNTAKGPGVHCLRVQSDKLAYMDYMSKIVAKEENLRVMEGICEDFITENNTIQGAVLEDGTIIHCKKLVLTTGTYMNSDILVGLEKTPGGPDGQKTTSRISASLIKLGFPLFRLKTGTPPRVKRDSVDLSLTSEQPGSEGFHVFSWQTKPEEIIHNPWSCYLTYTNQKTHDIIRAHLSESAVYGGVAQGTGPRYCPSIEDKVVRFADKERHQIFLEPESKELDTLYVQGFSTSLPHYVQEEILHTLPGLERAEIVKYAYAIEYDAINPLSLWPSLEAKHLSGFFCGGQINGTSGYEEAAGQGLVAGINAVRSLRLQEPVILGRDQAYIGVMIDDLVTKGTTEPYRLLTSRAEYRLLLRHDNAPERLTQLGHQIGLLSEAQYQNFQKMQQQKQDLLQKVKDTVVAVSEKNNQILEQAGYDPIKNGIHLDQLIKRPSLGIRDFLDTDVPQSVVDSLEVDLKYEGYIEKQRREAKQLAGLQAQSIPQDLDYQSIELLSLEARQKLSQVQPLTLGQASRISGVTPADIGVLAVWLKQRGAK